jgi:hypothetical protein
VALRDEWTEVTVSYLQELYDEIAALRRERDALMDERNELEVELGLAVGVILQDVGRRI